MGQLKRDMGIMSYVYMDETPEVMSQYIEQHGLPYVQLDPRQSRLLGEDLTDFHRAGQIQKIFADRGIRVVGLSAYFLNLVERDIEKREHNIRVMERIIELAESFETNYILTETGGLHPTNHWRYHPDNDSEEAFDTLISVIDRLRNIAIKHNSVLLLEGFANHVLGSVDRASEIIRRLGTEGLGFVLDPFNYMKQADLEHQEEALEKIFSSIGRLSPIAHAKDAIYIDDKFKTPTAGTGKMDWALVGAKLEKYTPEIPLILEHVEPKDVAECLAFVRKNLSVTKTEQALQ